MSFGSHYFNAVRQTSSMGSRAFEKPGAAKQTLLRLNVVPGKVKFLICLISQALSPVLVAVLGVKEHEVCVLMNLCSKNLS